MIKYQQSVLRSLPGRNGQTAMSTIVARCVFETVLQSSFSIVLCTFFTNRSSMFHRPFVVLSSSCVQDVQRTIDGAGKDLQFVFVECLEHDFCSAAAPASIFGIVAHGQNGPMNVRTFVKGSFFREIKVCELLPSILVLCSSTRMHCRLP